MPLLNMSFNIILELHPLGINELMVSPACVLIIQARSRTNGPQWRCPLYCLYYYKCKTASQSLNSGCMELSVGYKRHHLQLTRIVYLWLADLNMCWEMPQSQGAVGSRDWWEFRPFFRGHWQSPCTALMAGKCLPLRLCMETVKESTKLLGMSWGGMFQYTWWVPKRGFLWYFLFMSGKKIF